jgi:hypothetical protein
MILPDDDDGSPERAVLPFPESLCHQCSNSRVVPTKTSTFVMCSALAAKYPRQPIVTCPAFTRRESLR